MIAGIGIALTGVALAILYLSVALRGESITPPVSHAAPLLPTQQPNQSHPTADQSRQPPSQELYGECDES